MKALCWYGREDVRVETVPDPGILAPRDVVLEVTSTAICGSDLHLYRGYIPTLQEGDVLGHEFMGEVVETGPEVERLAVGDRVVVAFPIACGRCVHCSREQHSLCDDSNPNAWMAEALYGHSGAGIFGYSHLLGGYAGGQAEYVRVPFADVGCRKVPDDLPDDKALFLSDIYPTGWQAAEVCELGADEVVAIWGCGPVGQFAIRSALLQGAGRVFAIDRVPERLAMAREAGAETLDYDEEDSLLEALDDLTAGRGPDACIDAVGLEAHGHGMLAWYDRAKHAVRLQTDRPTALRQAIQACRKGGVVSIPGVYGGVVDKFPLGAAFSKGLQLRMGQTHVQRYMDRLLGMIVEGRIDPSEIVTHHLPLDQAAEGYRLFAEKEDGCVKVVLQP
ncbi:MAG TPA: zinc-dependent alcohol dehydrogenase [Gemmatimonadota bacterium]|nr:zinc-dependent alcohol dehydrogenase [Gemmatimonadota bacterium]